MEPPSQETRKKPGSSLRQFCRVALAGTAYLGFGLGAPLIGLALPFVWLLGGTRLERRKRSQRFVAQSFRLFHAYMRWVGLIVYRPALTLPEQTAPRIVVANHPTLVDVTALLSAVPEMCCLVKSSIHDNPLFYLIMKFCGHIRVGRADADDGARVLELASKRVIDGSDVLLFPEGTRSPPSSLGHFQLGVGPFHAGAFAVAVHSEIEVAKVAIFCDPPVLKRGAPWYLIPPEPVALRLEFLGQSRPFAGESIHSFRDRVRDEIIHSYNQ